MKRELIRVGNVPQGTACKNETSPRGEGFIAERGIEGVKGVSRNERRATPEGNKRRP